MTTYLGDKPVGISSIVKQEVPKAKFGATVDTFIGDVDDNGVLQAPSGGVYLNFSGVKELSTDALAYRFHEAKGIVGANFSSLQKINANGLYYAFNSAKNLEQINLSSLQYVGDLGLGYAFYYCQKITNVDLSSLKTVSNTGMSYAFYQTSLVEVEFQSLETLGSRALMNAFRSCNKLKKVSFPSLTAVQADSFGTSSSVYAFGYSTALTEIHFRADMQATIEAMSGYSSKWGATNATIIFDL